MTERARILIVEDQAADAELARTEVQRAGVDADWRRVETQAAFRSELRGFSPHLVVTDFTLPGFSGLEALAIAREVAPDTPVVVFTGSHDEDTAVACFKAGAWDYVVKERPGHLGPRVVAGLRVCRERELRRQAEQEVLECKNRYEAAIRSSGRILYDWDSVTNEVTFAGALEETLGYGLGELGGDLAHWIALVHPDDRAAFESEIQRVIETEKPYELVYRVRRKDGGYLNIEDEGHFYRDGGGSARRMVGFLTDITERKRLEEQYRQSQKMEAVGRLAGGIAHDFNNILNVIMGYANMLRRETGEGDRSRQRVDQILRGAERAAGLTRQLLAFSRKQVLEPRVVDPNALLRDMEAMLGRLIGEDVELRLKLTAIGRVRVDPGQLEQVVMNLVVNAREAMPTGGTVILETADFDVGPEYLLRREIVEPGPYVMVAVSDTGVGMLKAIQDRVFEPFFTTKPAGTGTGLGLATVYGIVKQSGGYVWVYSEVGHGTTFKIYLPRVEAPVEPTEPAQNASAPTRGTETILVVEDEPALRALVVEMLRDEGYRVLQAEDGGTAVLVAEAAGATLHLLLTDVVLPKLSGRAAADRIVAKRPGLKVLYMSGYTDEAISHHDVLDPGVALLQKPFAPSELLRRVRDVLNEK